VVDAFVDELDLQALEFERVHSQAYRSPKLPSCCIIKLYIYGYLNSIQSYRRLEKEAHRNVELM
jgi:transposase